MKKVLFIFAIVFMLLCCNNVFAENLTENDSEMTTTQKVDPLLEKRYTDSANVYGFNSSALNLFSALSSDDADYFAGSLSKYETNMINNRIDGQGNTNSCWVYASLSALEFANYKNDNYYENLSEEHMKQSIYGTEDSDLSRKYRYIYNKDDPGRLEYVLAYLTRGEYNGPILQSDMSDTKNVKSMEELGKHTRKIGYYPYECRVIPQMRNNPSNSEKKVRIDLIKSLVQQYGSVAISLDIGREHFYSYEYERSPRYYNNVSGSKNLSHMVTIYGWDDTLDKLKFANGAKHNGGFICEDSQFGQKTIISYDSIDKIYEFFVFTNVGKNLDQIYEHDSLGYVTYSSVVDNTRTINKFKKVNENEFLKKMQFWLLDTGTKFKVVFSKDSLDSDNFSSIPIKGYTPDANGWYQADFTGLTTVEFENPIYLDSSVEDYYIGIELKNGNSNIRIPVEEVSDNPFAKPEVNKGESYNGSINSSNSWKYNECNYNHCIKVFASTCLDGYYMPSTDKNNIDMSLYGDYKINYPYYFKHFIELIGDKNNSLIMSKSNTASNYFDSYTGSIRINSSELSNTKKGGVIQLKVYGKCDIIISAKGLRSGKLGLYDSNYKLIKSVDVNENLNTYKFDCSFVNEYIGNIYYIGSIPVSYQGKMVCTPIDIFRLSINKPGESLGNYNINSHWNFSELEYYNRDYSSAGEINGLHYTGGMNVEESKTILNNYKYNHLLNLAGKGNKDYRSVYFDVPKGANIYITLRSSNSEDRQLVVYDEYNSIYATLTATSNAKSECIKYTGDGGRVYISSISGGIKIYDIFAETPVQNNELKYNIWDFDDSKYGTDRLGETISSPIEDGELTIYHGSFECREKTTDIPHSVYLEIPSSNDGTRKYNSVGLNVKGKSKVKIVAAASANGHNLMVADKHNILLTTIPLYKTEMSEAIIDVEYDNTIYLRGDATVQLYSIEIYNDTLSDEISDVTATEGEAGKFDSVLSGTAIEIEDDVVSDASLDVNLNNSMMSRLATNRTNGFMYKNQLSGDELYVYNQLYHAFIEKQYTNNVVYINIPVKILANAQNKNNIINEFSRAISAFVYDYPEAFWISRNFKQINKLVSVQNNNSYIMNKGVIISRNTYVGSADFIKNSMINSLTQNIDKLISDVETQSNLNSDYLKLEYVYNRLKESTIYITGNAKYNAYSSLVEGRANCSGISHAFKMVCNEMGIDCVLVNVNINNKRHLCNLVYLNNKWYLCDLTEDIVNNTQNQYFMIAMPDNYVSTSTTLYPDRTGGFDIPLCSANDYQI